MPLRRAAGWLLAAALLLVVSCDAHATNQQPSPTHRSPEAGPQFLVSIWKSEYGELSATTWTGAACTASATMPDGRRMELGRQTASQQGSLSWSYAKSSSALGQGVHSLSCSLRGQTATNSAYFVISL